MIRIIEQHGDDNDAKILQRPPVTISDAVKDIVNDVKESGDTALHKYEKKFADYTGPLLITDDTIQDAYETISDDLYDSIKIMANTLRKTERTLYDTINSIPESDITRRFCPIPSVGCYIPGGQARYASSAVMSIVPAAVAGVPRIVAVSPPPIDIATIVAAHHCGAHQIYQTGGAHAVAALAYGTKTIRPVRKIVGPGGSIVSQAKRLVSNVVSVDMDAGPTELGIVADSSANPDFVAADMISQAEHSADTCCFLLTDSADMARSVADIIERRLSDISRSDIVRDSLYTNGFIALCDDIPSALRLAEEISPEHLQIMTANCNDDVSKVQSPGLILLGDATPSAASDYMLGSNHILPTNNQGHTRGPLSVLDFVKMKTVVRTDDAHLREIAPHIQQITKSEGLSNHYEAVRYRAQPDITRQNKIQEGMIQ